MRVEAILARNLKRLRHIQGISQEELAHQAGLNRTYLGDIENKKHSISVGKLDALAIALGVKACDLIDAEFEP